MFSADVMMNSPTVVPSSGPLPAELGKTSKRKREAFENDNGRHSASGFDEQVSHIATFETGNPTMIDNTVKLIAHSWSKLQPVHPNHFLTRMLETRGYGCHIIPSERM